MKKMILFMAIFAFCFSKLKAQGNNDKIEALKIAFITKRLNLSPEESQKFWPIYDQYEAEKRQNRISTIGSVKELKEDGDFTNAEAEIAITKFVEFKSKELDLVKKYITEFRKILPAAKIAKLVTAEEKFKKMLTKQAQQGGGQWPQNPYRNGGR